MTNEPYHGREQTQAKHFVLRRYLQALTYKLLESGQRELTYVDGFSGPWESRTTDFSDTSFMIALSVLQEAHNSYSARGETVVIKCFFVEADAVAYAQLKGAVASYDDPTRGFHVRTFHGLFQNAIGAIGDFAGTSFSLVFIDPTGWTGYPLRSIAPLLRRLPGEVLINFMYDHINRFVSSSDPATVASLAPILGGDDWTQHLDPNLPRGPAVEKRFREVLKSEGDFDFVLSTQIDKATADRPHFFIVYGSRHAKGLSAFRDVEYKALQGHNRRRQAAKLRERDQRSGTPDLFADLNHHDDRVLDEMVTDQMKRASSWICNYVADCEEVSFKDLWTAVLQVFMLRVTNVKEICVELASEGMIENTWSASGKRKPDDGYVIRLSRRGNDSASC